MIDRKMLQHQLIAHALSVSKGESPLIHEGRVGYFKDEAWVERLLELAEALAEQEKSLWQNVLAGNNSKKHNLF